MPRQCRKSVISLIVLACALTCCSPSHPATNVPAQKSIPVSTEQARKGDIGNYVQALGTVTSVYTVTIFSRVQGQIMSVNYKEGQDVKRDDSLIEIDSRPYEAAVVQAQGQLAHDRAVLQQARIDLIRYRKAWKKNAIQKQLLDDQEQIALQSEGTVKADEGLLKAALANLSYCHIRSPIDGRVGLRLLDPGNIVQANSTTALLVVAQIHPITVIFNVAEDFLPEIQQQIRLKTPMPVEAYDRTQQRKIATGLFLSLDNLIDTTTGTVRIRATFNNGDETLFPNQFVNVKLLVNTKKDVTLLSSNAVQMGAQGSFVYVIRANRTAEMRAVQVGIVNAGVAEIQGVKSGEEVAVTGFDKLQEGAKVSIVRGDHQMAGTVESRRAQ